MVFRILVSILLQPKISHLEATQRIVEYTKKQPVKGLLLSSKPQNRITIFCDVDWEVCPQTRWSITGFLVNIGESLVAWKSKKQTIISWSSAESEYKSLASTVAELVWLIGILKEIGFELKHLLQSISIVSLHYVLLPNPVFNE